MFTTEQYSRHYPKNATKNEPFRLGMPLVNRNVVKTSFTYKELSLVVGIIVAIIIIFTLWFNQIPFVLSFEDVSIPFTSLPGMVNSFAEKAMAVIQF
ncbi:MAG: hypothetical protein JNM57_03875 [Cyclobacteriaceae bacterium]|nr:hypothetical protein [Cyclobacteriaceae bacterium]